MPAATKVRSTKELADAILAAGYDAFYGGSEADESSFEWLAEQIRDAGARSGARGLFASVRDEDPSGMSGRAWANIGAVRLGDVFLVPAVGIEKWQKIAQEETGEFGDGIFASVAAAFQIHGEDEATAEKAKGFLRRLGLEV